MLQSLDLDRKHEIVLYAMETGRDIGVVEAARSSRVAPTSV